MSFLILPTSTSAGRPESRNCLVKRGRHRRGRGSACGRRLERRKKGEKIDPFATQMASYLACLRSSARFALVRTSLRGSCFSGPGWWPRVARLMNSWLVTPTHIGLVDVTSRSQFRAAGLSIVVTPASCRRVGVQVVDERRLDVLVQLVALVCLEAVGHKVVAVPHRDGLLGLRVLAAA